MRKHLLLRLSLVGAVGAVVWWWTGRLRQRQVSQRQESPQKLRKREDAIPFGFDDVESRSSTETRTSDSRRRAIRRIISLNCLVDLAAVDHHKQQHAKFLLLTRSVRSFLFVLLAAAMEAATAEIRSEMHSIMNLEGKSGLRFGSMEALATTTTTPTATATAGGDGGAADTAPQERGGWHGAHTPARFLNPFLCPEPVLADYRVPRVTKSSCEGSKTQRGDFLLLSVCTVCSDDRRLRSQPRAHASDLRCDRSCG